MHIIDRKTPAYSMQRFISNCHGARRTYELLALVFIESARYEEQTGTLVLSFKPPWSCSLWRHSNILSSSFIIHINLFLSYSQTNLTFYLFLSYGILLSVILLIHYSHSSLPVTPHARARGAQSSIIFFLIHFFWILFFLISEVWYFNFKILDPRANFVRFICLQRCNIISYFSMIYCYFLIYIYFIKKIKLLIINTIAVILKTLEILIILFIVFYNNLNKFELTLIVDLFQRIKIKKCCWVVWYCTLCYLLLNIFYLSLQLLSFCWHLHL